MAQIKDVSEEKIAARWLRTLSVADVDKAVSLVTMEKPIKLMSGVLFVIAVLFSGGCAGSGGGASHTYYHSYHDPYPYWGRDVYVHHDYDHRPVQPGYIKPKTPSMGRPSQLPSGSMSRPSLRRR